MSFFVRIPYTRGNGRPGIMLDGPFVSYDEALKVSERSDKFGAEVIELPTNSLEKATRILKHDNLKEGEVDLATSNYRHEISSY